jgi:CRISPR/Cas system CSM-associated protein Csm4 (group 5 of RAMP superfamily)
VLGRTDKYLAFPPYTVHIEMLDEQKHKRKTKKVDVQFQQDWSELVQGERKYKRVAYCRTEP